MKTEIEVKFRIPKAKLVGIRKWLGKHGKKIGSYHHIEYYLDNPEKSFTFVSPEGFVDASDYLRVRMTSKGESVCFKHWHYDEESKSHTHCDEYETEVKDGKALLELLKAIGFTNSIVVDKKRESFATKEFEVVIDEVKGLGSFVEVELKKRVSDPKFGLALIYQFIRSLGLTRIEVMSRGYVSMLWNPTHDFGEKLAL